VKDGKPAMRKASLRHFVVEVLLNRPALRELHRWEAES